MVTEAKQAQAVIDAEKKYKRKITVAFNYRYAPKHEKIKQILRSRRDRQDDHRSILAGTSIPATAQIISGDGTGSNPAAAACGYTRPRTTST